MSIENLDDLFLHELKDVYDAEKQILKALPKMAKAASTDELRAAFEGHRDQTEEQIARLEKSLNSSKSPARGKKCMGMEGLLEEGEEFMKEDAQPAVMDAGLIAAAQKVEHYEIASYGTLATYAKILGLDEAVGLLEETFAEEKETDEKLTELASQIIPGRNGRQRRELINTGKDKRFMRRRQAGNRFNESDDVGRSLAADRRQGRPIAITGGEAAWQLGFTRS